jgi:hypothetical protein
MKSLDVRKYNMLVRVRDYGAARADLFPPGSLGARTFGEIGTVVDRLNASVTSERSGRRAARQGVVSKAAARAGLHRALEAVSRTARGVALDTPDILGKFHMPDAQKDHELATAARQFADEVTPLAAAFIAHGLPESFVADLRGALATFERAIGGRALGRETHVGARADIAAALDLAFETLRRLDAIVENRVGRRSQRARGVAPRPKRRPDAGERGRPRTRGSIAGANCGHAVASAARAGDA